MPKASSLIRKDASSRSGWSVALSNGLPPTTHHQRRPSCWRPDSRSPTLKLGTTLVQKANGAIQRQARWPLSSPTPALSDRSGVAGQIYLRHRDDRRHSSSARVADKIAWMQDATASPACVRCCGSRASSCPPASVDACGPTSSSTTGSHPPAIAVAASCTTPHRRLVQAVRLAKPAASASETVAKAGLKTVSEPSLSEEMRDELRF